MVLAIHWISAYSHPTIALAVRCAGLNQVCMPAAPVAPDVIGVQGAAGAACVAIDAVRLDQPVGIGGRRFQSISQQLRAKVLCRSHGMPPERATKR